MNKQKSNKHTYRKKGTIQTLRKPRKRILITINALNTNKQKSTIQALRPKRKRVHTNSKTNN